MTPGQHRPRPLRLAAWLAVVAITAALVVGWLVRPRPTPPPDDVPDLRVPSHVPSPHSTESTPSYPPSPLPSSAVPPAPPAERVAEYSWSARAAVLRPELDSPQVIQSPDGSRNDIVVPQAKGVWMVMTGQTSMAATPPVPDARVRVHGLEAVTGRELWRRDMSFGLCATQLLDGRLACASSLARDERTGLPTRWRLHLLDPATGRTTAQRDVDAWLSMVAVHQDRLVLVEQRQPAPHLVVSGFSSDLSPVWRADLARQARHADFFSDNRNVTRADLSPPDGPALENVRLRPVDAMLALWGNGPTAFIDVADGRVRGVPRCSRLVDDGTRIWCNEGERAVAWSRDLARVVAHTQPGVRLAFPRLDQRHGGRSVPVFLNSSLQMVRVDPATGRGNGEVIADTRSRNTVAGRTEPLTVQAGGAVLVDDSDGVIGLDGTGQQARWASPHYLHPAVLSHGSRVLVQDRQTVDVLDPATGKVQLRLARLTGEGLVGVGTPEDDAFASIGQGVVARLQLP